MTLSDIYRKAVNMIVLTKNETEKKLFTVKKWIFSPPQIGQSMPPPA